MTVLKGALIAVAISCMGLFSGIIFGWGTLQLILEEEGLYSSGCTDDDDICPSRQNKFFLLYTISTSTFLVASFFSGMAVDKYGPTKVAIFVSSTRHIGFMAGKSNPSDVCYMD